MMRSATSWKPSRVGPGRPHDRDFPVRPRHGNAVREDAALPPQHADAAHRTVAGRTKAGAVDREHLVSAVDFLPTLLDMVGAPHPDGLDGRSFEPLLQGSRKQDANMRSKSTTKTPAAFATRCEPSNRSDFSISSIPGRTARAEMFTATQGTPTYRPPEGAGQDRQSVGRAARMRSIIACSEELYDVESDPDCLKNLIDDPAHKDDVAELRNVLEQSMEKTGDPVLEVFRHRDDLAVRETVYEEG